MWVQANLSRLVLVTAASFVAVPAWANYTTSAYAGAEALVRAVVDGNDPLFDAKIDYQNLQNVAGKAADVSAGMGIGVQDYGATAAGSSTAWAHASAGGIHLNSSGAGNVSWPAASSVNVLGRGIGSANASFSDVLIVNVGNLAAGTEVMVNYSVNVTGSFGWNGQGNSAISGYRSLNSMSWSVSLNNTSIGYGSDVEAANGDILFESYAGNGVHILSATGIVGQGVDLYMRAQIGASGQAAAQCNGNCGGTGFPHYAEGSGTSHFGSTFAWNGIQSVTDMNGTILQWTVSSASGFDYSAAYVSAVPELPGGAMMLAGMGLLLGWLRRRPAPHSTAPASNC